MHFGIREYAIGAIVNGMGLCYLRALGSTFLIFSDYMRPAIRLAALMELPVFHVFTHNSIGVGEDGHASAGRTTPELRRIPASRYCGPRIQTRCARLTSSRSVQEQSGLSFLSRQALPVFAVPNTRQRKAWRAAPISWPMPKKEIRTSV